MEGINRRLLISFLGLLSLILGACGPVASQKVRYTFESGQKRKITIGNLTVETVDHSSPGSFPPANFSYQTQVCGKGQNGMLLPLVDSSGNPVIEIRSLAMIPGIWWDEIMITNVSNNTARFGQSYVRLFTPSDQEIEPIMIPTQIVDSIPCIPERLAAMKAIETIKFYGPATMIPPNRSIKVWTAFKVPLPLPHGQWRMSFYEFPSEINETGIPTKTTQFDFDYKVRKFIDHYEAKNSFAEPALKKTEEVK